VATDDDDEELWTPEEAARVLKVSVRTLAWWRQKGTGPPYLKAGRFIRYRPSEVREWLRRER
jgi:predicted site-specific integrase-resolvase